ncbi:N-methyl-L-tryptophan oxidase [Crystallibacter degradans]|uniref:N-methyl-L-tryptophan oxidase n=1 Tax=Crystallibacter degradans TaxID=2726743 RepID=UPI0014735F66|nr:N-methyl-L-tryptophan oxidase [Arthrobacter sp. SF27]
MDADVAVVGLGTMGSMAAWRLSQQTSLRVLGFEQFGLGHAHGSAAGESRLFRAAYHEDPGFVPFLLQARKLWQELSEKSMRELFLPTGTLSIGFGDAPQLENVFASVDHYDLPHEILDSADLARRFPQHKLTGGEIGVLDHLGGGIRPELAVTSALEQAKKNGADLHAHEPVMKIRFEEDGVHLTTERRTYVVGKVIIASGAWTDRLLPELKGLLVIKPLLLTWFTPLRISEFMPAVFPTFIRDTQDFHIFGAPVLDGFSVKISVNDIFDPIESPDSLIRYFDAETVSAIGHRVAELVPGVFPEPVRHTVHLDSYLPERNPIIGNFESTGRGIILAGFSGHGFKLAPVIGDIAARISTDQETGFNLEAFAPSRVLQPTAVPGL